MYALMLDNFFPLLFEKYFFHLDSNSGLNFFLSFLVFTEIPSRFFFPLLLPLLSLLLLVSSRLSSSSDGGEWGRRCGEGRKRRRKKTQPQRAARRRQKAKTDSKMCRFLRLGGRVQALGTLFSPLVCWLLCSLGSHDTPLNPSSRRWV